MLLFVRNWQWSFNSISKHIIMRVILSHLILSSCVSSCHLSLCFLIINELNKYVFLVCRYGDYLRISNDNHYTVGTYCGVKSGLNISFTGRYAVLTFHSDGYAYGYYGYRGYKLDFSFVSPGK